MPPERRTGPEVATPQARLNVENPHDTDKPTVHAPKLRGRCRRCGGLITQTTLADLVRCTALARTGTGVR